MPGGPTNIRLADRPLIVSDIDDVVLQFIEPFGRYLDGLGHRLVPRSFRIHGNVISKGDGVALEDGHVTTLIREFFLRQGDWQLPFETARETLHELSSVADIVFLTTMPPDHIDIRRSLLDRLGLAFPMIATESPKGPVVKTLHGGRAQPLAFVDDMVHNLASVAADVPECLLIHLPPPSEIHKLVPPPADGVSSARDWSEAAGIIRRHFLDAPSYEVHLRG